MGRNPTRSLKELELKMLDEWKRICCSKLTDWQKVDAINCFVMSKANYPLRLSLLNASWCQRIDGQVRKMVKPALNLPRRTSTDYLYSRMNEGGRGLVSLEDNREEALIIQFYCTLTCPDPMVQETAWGQLNDTIKAWTNKHKLTKDDICMFLNSTPARNETRQCRDVVKCEKTPQKVQVECGVWGWGGTSPHLRRL